MIKQLNLLIHDSCAKCPYSRYEEAFDWGYGPEGSGWNCIHPTKGCERIISDIKPGSVTNVFDVPIPDWCPLPTYVENNAYEAAQKLGIIGCVSGPTDLSTNPKYMEGFGESLKTTINKKLGDSNVR